jgi:meiotically up-regulated gene 157 (Mug157) protein
MSCRPKIPDRKFISEAVEKTIAEVKQSIKDEELAELFENCFPNTLDTTINYSIEDGVPDTFVITGDIEAMWLRDSSAQVNPYLSLLNEDQKLKGMIKGVINRQAKCILLDPYANAFTYKNDKSPWAEDLTEMKPGVFERKWEIDSLCYPVRLAYKYWKITGDISCFDNNWREAASLIYKTFREQQRFNSRGPYKFGRITGWSTDTVPGNGFGNPVNPVGLVVSVFRPSDDCTIFPFLIPANFYITVILKQLSEIFDEVYKDAEFSSKCMTFRNELKNVIYEYGVAEKKGFGKIYAYETDGFGNHLFMDDANIPCLLALPYLECCSVDDPVYQNTRKYLLSKNNPYFFTGRAVEGIGSPHTLVNKIWPISIITRAITSSDDEEIKQCLGFLKATHAGTGFMHESFDKDDAGDFTRKWFAWANSFFAELILKLYKERPQILSSVI